MIFEKSTIKLRIAKDIKALSLSKSKARFIISNLKERDMQKKEAWVISVDMGYGHQRAAYPLKDIAYERIITANSDKIISEKERRIWHRLKVIYETLSRIKQFPIIGKILFGIYDHFQNISPFFPFRDLSKPTFPVIYFWKLIKKKGLCKSLIDYVQNKDIPFITTHFIPALAADYHGLKKIYCIVTDTDINRVWVSYHPKKSNITYLAPCRHTAFRLKEYGVPDNLVMGANIAGFLKVADSMLAQGII